MSQGGLFNKPHEDNINSASTGNLKNVMFSSVHNSMDIPKSALGGMRDSSESHALSTMPRTASINTEGIR
jgi:hypothetical protein